MSIDMRFAVCIKCEEKLPRTKEYFYENGREDKFKGKCKECYKKDANERKQKNKERGIIYNVNPEKKREAGRRFYEKHKEKLKEAQRKYYHEKRNEYKKQLEKERLESEKQEL